MRGADSRSLFGSDWALSEALGEGERTAGSAAHTLHTLVPGSKLTRTYTHMAQHELDLGSTNNKNEKGHEVLRESCNQFLSFHLVSGETHAHHSASLLCSVRMRVYAGVFIHALGGQRKMLRVFFLLLFFIAPRQDRSPNPKFTVSARLYGQRALDEGTLVHTSMGFWQALPLSPIPSALLKTLRSHS